MRKVQMRERDMDGEGEKKNGEENKKTVLWPQREYKIQRNRYTLAGWRVG